MSQAIQDKYYVPETAKWPFVGSISLTMLFCGFAAHLNGNLLGPTFMVVGFILFIIMLFGWFSTVVNESETGTYRRWEDTSFRMGMCWFIFSEVMFFAAFFGALYYAREFSVPWLLGEGSGLSTHNLLWPDYSEIWPTNGPADLGESDFHMGWWPLPFLNTVILLTSGLTVTWAHHAIKIQNRKQIVQGLFLTVALGFLFVFLQGVEYVHAYDEGMKLNSGIYGSTFFMLTGFHGMHVTLGAIMLTVMLFRAMRGHFTKERHFAFEAAAWYWHFVDVVWLGLFIFVYIL
ncbi:MAG: cytochrome c oxidase subunit 3 [Gammaproteobacteria bacterium]|nr:cytochrome c oxidase subunit 3 [Gammaproteobacteria bacterium]MYJ51806.1 cytochrome c oxidase subunit 3 [Gammaproteobacteria bacterium]